MAGQLDQNSLEALLLRAEGDTLDFKRDQYNLDDDRNKAKLIKDILAFANTWANEDAHILIGVDEQESGRHAVPGIAAHLEESNLQQLVNSKTNKPIEFSYFSKQVDGKTVGVLRISARQGRPFYLKKDFGGLRASEVHLRRGSSTAVASPDEIAQMGIVAAKHSSKAAVAISLVDESGHAHAERLTLAPIVLRERPPPSEEEKELAKKLTAFVPTFETSFAVIHFPVSPLAALDRGPSVDEVREYHRQQNLLKELTFQLHNPGDVVLTDVRISASVKRQEALQLEDSLPRRPTGPFAYDMPVLRRGIVSKEWTRVTEESGGDWTITARVAKVRPGESVETDPFYIGSTEQETVLVETTIFADNLSPPVTKQFEINLVPETRWYSKEHDELPENED